MCVCPPLGNLKEVHLPGLLRDRWRALETQHPFLNKFGLLFWIQIMLGAESGGNLELS